MLREAPKKSIARYAMEYGVYFGIYLIVKFALTTFSLNNFVANFVSEVLLIAIPFILYYIMRHYKKQDGGNVRFSQLWMFGIFLFFFASLRIFSSICFLIIAKDVLCLVKNFLTSLSC